MKNLFARLTLAAMVVVMASSTGWAGAYKKIEKLLSTSQNIIGEEIQYPGGTAKITAAVVTINPGEETKWHKHGVPLFAYMVSGTLTVDYGDKGTRTYGPGEAFMEAMDQWHRGTNKTDQPARVLAVYMGSDKAENVIVKP